MKNPNSTSAPLPAIQVECDTNPSPAHPILQSYPWVEGRGIPRWVAALATGPTGCESVYVVAELQPVFQRDNGYPDYVLAYLDIRLGRCICAQTAANISGAVVRYLPFDRRPVTATEGG